MDSSKGKQILAFRITKGLEKKSLEGTVWLFKSVTLTIFDKLDVHLYINYIDICILF